MEHRDQFRWETHTRGKLHWQVKQNYSSYSSLLGTVTKMASNKFAIVITYKLKDT
jgi:hypothetical protein